MPHSDPAPSPHSVPARRWSWWVKRSAPAAAVALCAWVGWREYDHRAAIREAQAAGWGWESRDPVALIRGNWRAAGKKATWTNHYRRVALPVGTDLATAGPRLARLRPTSLVALRCPDTHLAALGGLTALQSLNLSTSRWHGYLQADGVLPRYLSPSTLPHTVT